jgi:folate-binding protein YgfZ
MNSTANGFYIDVSDSPLLRLDGADGLDLLQRISTNDVSKLKVGEHAETVLTTDKGRIFDVILVFRASFSSLILAGLSKTSAQLSDWIGRFIVMEDAMLSSLVEERVQLLLFGLREDSIINDLTEHNAIIVQPKYQCGRGILCVVERATRSHIESLLLDHGIAPADTKQYDTYRIRQGIPGYPGEISAQFNPLEAGLESLVSFTKGCYVGQEVIARLDTYKKTLRALRPLVLTVPPNSLPVELFTQEREKAGVLTSCTSLSGTTEQIYGLGIILPQQDKKQLIYSRQQNDFVGKAEVVSR